MDYQLKDIQDFINAINRVDIAKVEVEINENGVCNNALTSNKSLKVKITPPDPRQYGGIENDDE